MNPAGTALELAYTGLLDHVSMVMTTTAQIVRLCTLAVAAHEAGNSEKARTLAKQAADLEYELTGSCEATGRIEDLVDPESLEVS